MDDNILIEKVLAGNTAAFRSVVVKYQHMAVSLAYNILLNQEDAEEAVQDAFVKVFQKLHTFKGDAKFSTWLYRIVFTTAINKSKRKRLPVQTLEEQAYDESSSAEVEEQLNNYQLEEQKRYIQLALLALKEDERICITLFYLQELSVSEIEETTAFSASNIKILLFRGRKKLFAALQKLLKGEYKDIM